MVPEVWFLKHKMTGKVRWEIPIFDRGWGVKYVETYDAYELIHYKAVLS